VIRISMALLCALAGAAERWLLGQTPGDIILSGLALGVGFILCSPRASSLQSQLKIAVLLGGVVFAADLLSLAITSLIDGMPSLAGGSWMASLIIVWLILNQPKVSRWAELRPMNEEASHG